MDIYIPGQAPLALAKAPGKAPQQGTAEALIHSTSKNSSDALRTKPGTEQLPVALFCHGGVWATGATLVPGVGCDLCAEQQGISTKGGKKENNIAHRIIEQINGNLPCYVQACKQANQ